MRNRTPVGHVAPPIAGEHTRDLVDAKTAALILGIKTQTLYAYVSRGLIRAVPNHGRKSSLYPRQEIEALRATGRSAAVPLEAADRMRWSTGTVLQTAITSIDSAGPRYRGKLATDLASMRRPFEDCVELLWSGILPASPTLWQPALVPASFLRLAETLAGTAGTSCSRQLLALLTSAYAAAIGPDPETTLGAPLLAGRHLLQVLAPAVGLLRAEPLYRPAATAQPLAAIIADAAGVAATQETLEALNACLILSADHELAPSTFAARVAASGGADLFSCVGSGLGSFSGALTGLGCDVPEGLLRTAASPRDYVASLRDLMRRREVVLGYDHPLYPSGDPRAPHLLDMARAIGSRSAAARRVLACIDAATGELGLVPSLALGLIAVSAGLDLPERAPGALMAIGRVSGWIAHVFEQRLAGSLVRPRTRYIGPAN